MTEEELGRLAAAAVKAFEERRFDDEAAIWERIVAAFPDRYPYLSNLASARANQGRLLEALQLFDEVLEKAPDLSRAHNNRASVLLSLGVDIQHLVPAFAAALETSDSPEEFERHLYNICNAAAYGPDRDGGGLLEGIERRVREIVREQYPPSKQAEVLEHISSLIEGHRHIAAFRTALAQRRWADAMGAVLRAKETFQAGHHDYHVFGTKQVLRCLETSKKIFDFLESVGSGRISSVADAAAALGPLLRELVTLTTQLPSSPMSRFLEVLGWFVTLLLYQVRFLSSTDAPYEHIDDDVQAMIWLTSSSFRQLGDELISIINTADRLCHEATSVAGRTAGDERVLRVKTEAWTRLTLFINGRVFDFRGLDVELARTALRWQQDAVAKLRQELLDFRAFIERQAFRDVFVDSRPQENIARALLQARLRGRSYREVPARGGKSDVLLFADDSGKRALIETKIWRGAEYFEQGLRELEQYLLAENDDAQLLAAFYVVFDDTETARAVAHVGSVVAARQVAGVEVSILIVKLRPPRPSQA